MPRYLIERDVPGAEKLTAEQLAGIAAKSCEVLQELGPRIQWVQTYATKDKLTCIYVAPNEDLIRTHAAKGGFPVTRISEVTAIMDPVTAERATPARP